MLGIFYKEKEEYKNQLNPVEAYVRQLGTYISVERQIPLNEAIEAARRVLKSNFKDKPVKYFVRAENGDRDVDDTTLLKYISDNIASKNILVPTFTSYMNRSEKKSILSEFIFENVKKRGIAKKIGQKAKAEGNLELADAKNNEQNMMKIYNNSMSGAFAQAACVLHNPTAHSTLTSITRTITGLSNSSNEKLISGNRYYPRGIDVINNIVYIVTYTDLDFIKTVVDKYNLNIPTVEETIRVLRRSSDLYFMDTKFYVEKIVPFLTKLDKYYLAAICYAGDLYTLRSFNDIFIRGILSSLIQPIETDTLVEIPELYKVNENILNFVHHIFYSQIRGLGKDYTKMDSKLVSSIYATSKHIESVLLSYKDFFNCFFMTEIMPSNSHRLKNMRRRTVVLSDTDSTCFTLDEWAIWYNNGDFIINKDTIALTGCVAYIAAQVIINQLAILSKCMNISTDLLNTLAMKNEYLWLAHTPAEVSKHYFAYTVIQEGNVFKEADLEIKGVHLKNSSVPKLVIDDSRDLMKNILSSVANNLKLKLNDIIARVTTLEESIIASVYAGELTYLKKSKIKNKEAYANDETKSPYQRHTFWIDIFSKTYGDIQDPPYDVIKIPTTVKTRVMLNNWIDGIEDINIKERLSVWLLKYNKTNLPTVYLNEVYVRSNGIPKELMSIIDIKRVVLDVTLQHRVILETLGIMLYPELLVKDQFMSSTL